MATHLDTPERDSLVRLSAELREATTAAVAAASEWAQMFDNVRSDVDRLLLSARWDQAEYRSLTFRSKMVLDVWRAALVRRAIE